MSLIVLFLEVQNGRRRNVRKVYGYLLMEEILKRINDNYDGLTDKTGPWNFLKRYYENF